MVGMSHAANPPSAKKRNREYESHSFRPIQCSARHFRHERVEQISEDHSDGYRDQNWLEETNDIGRRPDHSADDDDEKNHKAGSKRRPHSLALPRRGIFLHVTCRNAQRRIQEFGVGRSALDVRYLVSVGDHYVGFVFGKSLLILFLVSSTFSARFLFFGSSVSAFCQAANASAMRFNFK